MTFYVCLRLGKGMLLYVCALLDESRLFYVCNLFAKSVLTVTRAHVVRQRHAVLCLCVHGDC
jgi:hypothetical protein